MKQGISLIGTKLSRSRGSGVTYIGDETYKLATIEEYLLKFACKNSILTKLNQHNQNDVDVYTTTHKIGQPSLINSIVRNFLQLGISYKNSTCELGTEVLPTTVKLMRGWKTTRNKVTGSLIPLLPFVADIIAFAERWIHLHSHQHAKPLLINDWDVIRKVVDVSQFPKDISAMPKTNNNNKVNTEMQDARMYVKVKLKNRRKAGKS